MVRINGGYTGTRDIFDVRHLAAFAALSRTGSFTAAAMELSLTQSAVSHGIRVLEEAVQCELVDRSHKRVVLTQAGEQFLLHVDRILGEMRAARESLAGLARWGAGRLRIGTSAAMCERFLPGVLGEFRREFSRCAISVDQGDYAAQLQRLRDQQVDLAIVLEPRMQPDIAFTPLFEDEMRFAVAPGHPWADRGSSSAATESDTLILYRRPSYTSDLIDDYFRRDGYPCGNFIELGSMEAIRELSKTSAGVGILPDWIVRGELAAGSLVSLPLGRRRLNRTWGLAHLASRPLNMTEEAFVQLCRAGAANFAGAAGSDCATGRPAVQSR